MKQKPHLLCFFCMFVFFAGVADNLVAQGISNQGVFINIGGGFLLCQGDIENSGTVTNNGTVDLTGSLTNRGDIGGDGLLYIGGDWINEGGFDAGGGTVVFDGIMPQLIAAPFLTVFNNLTVDSQSAGTTVAAGAMVTVSGQTFSPNGKLIIASEGINNTGSLIYDGQGMPEGILVYNRRLPDDALYHYISSPVGATVLPVSGLFWMWNEPGGDWGSPVTENSAGAGYTVQANNSLLSFSGPVVTGEVSVPVTSPYADCDFPSETVDDYSERPYAPGRDGTTNYGGGGWNLLGNPYTSAVDATAFIAYNGEAFDQNYRALYIYNGDTYSYIGSELTGWENAGGLFGYSNIQACQGFFVAARCNSGLFVFTPEMQVHNTVVPYTKSAGSEGIWPGIHVRAVSSKGESSTLVVYNEKMSTGLDPGYDLGFMSSGAMIEIYTTFVSGPGGVSYARQALPAAGADTLVLPLGISFAEGGTVTFSAETVACGNLRYWLEDRETGIFTELGQKEYTASLPANTFGTGRFFIVASAGSPTGIKHPEQAESSLNIWVSDRQLTVSGTVRDGSVCELFDLQGRKLLGQKLSDGGLNRINLPTGLHGVFVVRVTDGTLVTARMVAVP